MRPGARARHVLLPAAAGEANPSRKKLSPSARYRATEKHIPSMLPIRVGMSGCPTEEDATAVRYLWFPGFGRWKGLLQPFLDWHSKGIGFRRIPKPSVPEEDYFQE